MKPLNFRDMTPSKRNKPLRHTDATALQATLRLERLMTGLIEQGAKTVSPALGAEILELMEYATQGEVRATGVYAEHTTTSVSHTWRARGETHTATLRATRAGARLQDGTRLTVVDHTSY